MIESNIYCPMIHGGLNLNLKNSSNQIEYNQCCLSTTPLEITDENFWNSEKLSSLRKANDQNQWHSGCWECQRAESAGHRSFRQALIDKFGVQRNLSGPQRIDLLFDRSCNLGCRTCGPESSTFWQQHLKQHNLLFNNFTNSTRIEDITATLKSLDLSNLGMVQFCGGETLMGNTYWKTADAIADLVPDAKNKITLGFQTNGTQPINQRHYKTIEKFHLVKILISLDCINERFNYLRWPADWNQVSDNILRMREELPVNVMFIVQETASSLNLYYHNEVSNWVDKNFSTNRLGDITNYARQLAMHQYLDVNNITQKYYDAISSFGLGNLLKPDWQENPAEIKLMIQKIEQFDKLRDQDWRKTFPEVAEFYSDYLR